MTLLLAWAGRSEIGPVREGNEDSGYAGARLAVIADGVGGMIAGEVASAIALQAMRQLDEDAAADPVDALASSLEAANGRLRAAVAADPGLEGMGTTLTALLWNGEQLGLAHVGDSRAYLLRDGRLEQVSTDHTFVQTLVDEGRITSEQARTHPHRSLILQALDGRTRIEPDLLRLEVAAGDRFLLCSDGLSDVLDTRALAEGLAVPDRQQAADRLVQAALAGGGSDNITCLVVDAVEADGEGGQAGDRPPDGPPAPLVLGAAASPEVAGLVQRLVTAGPARTVNGSAAPGARADQDPEDLRYAPGSPHRLRWVAWGLAVFGLLALLTGGAWMAYAWTQTQYFVAADDGRVAIYRGIPQQIPGVELAHLYGEPTDLRVDALPDFFRRKVTDGSVTAGTLAQARDVVANLTRLAARCPPGPAAAASTDCGPGIDLTSPTARPTAQPTPPLTPGPLTSGPLTSAGGPATAPAKRPVTR